MSTYYSANAFTVPEGLTGGVVTSISEDASVLNVDWRYPAGSTVPGHTGILLGGEAGNYTSEYSVANVACPEDNLLDGTLEEATIADAGYKYYKLADGNDGLGFYFAAEGGASITNRGEQGILGLVGSRCAGGQLPCIQERHHGRGGRGICGRRVFCGCLQCLWRKGTFGRESRWGFGRPAQGNLYCKRKENLKITNDMEKKKYSTPAVSVMALQQQDMLCGSPGSMGIHDEYTDAEQLSNRNIWDEIW